MAGGFQKGTSAPSTRYRKTIVTFDDWNPVVTQPPVQFERNAEQIGQSKDSTVTGAAYVKDVGWRIRSYQSDYGKFFELTAAQAGMMTLASGAATAASAYTESNFQRQSGLTGVSYDASVASSGFVGLQKQVTAAATWNNSLSADQAAFAGPSQTGESTDLDRVYTWNNTHEPSDPVHVWFTLPNHAVGGYAAFMQVYFTGPAGSSGLLTGYGQYCLRLYHDGYCQLYERGETPGDATHTAIWSPVNYWVWENSRQLTPGKTYLLTITSDTVKLSSGSYKGSLIVFTVNGERHSQPQKGGVLGFTAQGSAVTTATSTSHTYRVPQATTVAPTEQPVRVDVRRDAKPVFHTSKSKYPTSATIKDGVFSIDFDPAGDSTTTPAGTDFKLDWYSHSPSGCSVDAKLYDADTDTELTQVGSTVTDDRGGQKTYKPTEKQRRYYVKFTLTGNGSQTPTLYTWLLTKDPVWETPSVTTTVLDDTRSGTSLPSKTVARVTVTRPNQDPSTGNAVIVVNDFFGNLGFLGRRDNVPIKVETTYDSGGTNKSCLFRGYTQNASKRNRHTEQFPNWVEYTISCTGEWRRLQDVLSPRRFTWHDRNTDKPWKVTDLVVALLSYAYPDSMIEDPALDMELFVTSEGQNILEPSDPVYPVITRLLADYLGAYLVFDENAGTRGMWRVKQQKTYPYTNLVRFCYGHPDDIDLSSTKKLPHVDGAYGSDTVGSQTVTRTFIRKGTDSMKVERPEGNCVAVFGGALLDSASKASEDGAAMLTQVLYNVRSYNFLNLSDVHAKYPAPDATDPDDYLGYYAPIKVYDPTLSAQDAVDWVARRVYQYACFGRKVYSFQSPLILVTDSGDTAQTQPRPLGWYDAVQVFNGLDGSNNPTWTQWIVTGVTIAYGKDDHQYATYELTTSSAIDGVGSATGWAATKPTDAAFQAVKWILQRGFGLTGSKDTHNKAFRGSGRTPDWMALPEPTADAIQDLDPASTTFGQLLPTLGFDGLG